MSSMSSSQPATRSSSIASTTRAIPRAKVSFKATITFSASTACAAISAPSSTW
jgi:hypothetical protein